MSQTFRSLAHEKKLEMFVFEKKEMEKQPMETPCCVHIYLPKASLVLLVFCYKYIILGVCIQKLKLQMLSGRNTMISIIFFYICRPRAA